MRNVKQVDETDQSTDAEWRVMSRSFLASRMDGSHLSTKNISGGEQEGLVVVRHPIELVLQRRALARNWETTHAGPFEKSV